MNDGELARRDGGVMPAPAGREAALFHIELQRRGERWQAVIEGHDRPREVASLHQLIRWLVDLAAPSPRPPRDLR
ncbi:MAG: hypothetical protein JNJ42_06680 [Burkholderiaceae bacterium]|nr:hypothetical protein [Burkholderiaceae bacterium]